MLKPLPKNFRGLITISGPIKSGKSQLAEFLIKDQLFVTYIATSKPRQNDKEWDMKINIHRRRRPDHWKLIEYPLDICNAIEQIQTKDTLLIDSLGGLVDQHLKDTDNEWQLFQDNFVNCLVNCDQGIIVVAEEIGWGIVPATQIGHLFRERLSNLSYLISSNSIKKMLAINGIAIDLDIVGYQIP